MAGEKVAGKKAHDNNTIVVKFGSNCLFSEYGIDSRHLKCKSWNFDEVGIRDGSRFVVVASGAIALGKTVFGDTRKNDEIPDGLLQSYATVGQPMLMDMYEKAFGGRVGQVLLDSNMLGQKGMEGLGALLRRNLDLGVLSVVNYNDSTDFTQLRKDNDTLAAEVMKACGASTLVILGQYDGFMGSDGKVIERVSAIGPEHYALCNGTSGNGRGGFATKLDAAKIVLEANGTMIVGNVNRSLKEMLRGETACTVFANRNE